MTNMLTKEQKHAIAEKLTEYCKECYSNKKTFAYRQQTVKEWIKQAKKELGYSEVNNGNS